MQRSSHRLFVLALILAVPASADTVTFQDGVNGYAGTVDTYLAENDPATGHGAQDAFGWDTDEPSGSGEFVYGLLRFEDIFVSEGGLVPDGATITSATLTYSVFNVGDAANVHEVAVDWIESDTYNGFGGEAGVQTDEYAVAVVATATATSIGTVQLDVTSSVQGWSAAPAANRGWVFIPTNTDGVDLRARTYATIGERPLLTVEYEGEPQAPEAPVLVSPLDGATNVTAAPTLEVTVTDPQADPMDVTFYGRDTSASGGENFTIIHLPDTQHYSASYPAIYTAQTQWIVDNKDALNIQYVAHSGDCVNTASQEYQWINADASISLLEDPVTTQMQDGMPYAIAPGNHDQSPNGDPSGTQFFNQWFGVDRFLGRVYYGGHYPPANNDNSFTLFSGGGMDFIVINFEYDSSPDADVLQWADDLLSTYSNRRAILVAHFFMNIGDGASFGSQGQATYDALKHNPNLFLMLCGHMHGEGNRINIYDGRTIYTILADYQDLPNGGNGWLRILEFQPQNNLIRFVTYSPYLDQYGTDMVRGVNTTAVEFTLPYEMDGSGAFEVIGTTPGVASGSNATMAWPGRAVGGTYEWYVDVADGGSTTTGPVWTFTSDGTCTGNGDCDDGLYCNGSETCDAGNVCVPGSAPCAGQLCDEVNDVCVECQFDTDCADGDPCNGAEVCNTGTGLCEAGTPVDCAGLDNACNVGVCNPLSGECETEPANEGGGCDDGLSCTIDDKCTDGVCAGTEDCPVGRVCNPQTDTCTVPPALVEFQEGTDGYAGTVDTYLRQQSPNTSYGTAEFFEWDTDEGSSGLETIGLIRFDSIFGAGFGKIPAGSTVVSATLTLEVRDAGASADLREVLVDWTEAETYAAFGGDSGAQADEYGGTSVASVPASVGTQQIDVTASLQAWASDPSGNRGWILLPTGSAGAEAWSSEAASAGNRPRLSVVIMAGCESDSDCNDGNPCTDDACNGTNQCDYTFNTDPCDDGDLCTQTDACDGGACVGTNPISCPPDETCDPATGICNEIVQADPLPILAGDDWRYFKGTQEPPADWNTLSFDDSAWLTGPTGIGYADGDDATVLSDMQNTYVSVYARRLFQVEDVDLINYLTLTIDYDDAYVAYINGVEVARSPNIAGSPPAFDDMADPDHEASGGGNGAQPADVVNLADAIHLLLNNSNNVLAIQGHNQSLASSDFSLIPELDAEFAVVDCVVPGDCDDADLCTTDDCIGGQCQFTAVDCGAQFCNPADGACVDCLVNTDCSTGQVCSPSTHECTAGPVTVTFQDGINGYAGTHDTFLQAAVAAMGNVNGATAEWEWDDEDGGSPNYGLLRFDDIFGSGPGQVPVGATIQLATVTYVTTDPGVSAEVHEMLLDWDEAAANFTNVCDTSCDAGVEYAAGSVTSAPANPIQAYTIDVTSSLQAWASNPAGNYGWIFIPPAPGGTGGGAVHHSSEYATAAERPLLTVEYLNAPCTGDPDCDDGDPCNGIETCNTGTGYCVAGTPIDCGAQYCDPANGMCVDCLTDVHCDDLNPCTDDVCNSGTGLCNYTDNSDPCDDGDACTQNDVCGGGTCQPGTTLDCDDSIACTDDSCDAGLGCQNVDNCTGGEVCNMTTGVCEELQVPQLGDLIISGFLANPDPEWIELFNPTDQPISLEELDIITRLDIGTSNDTLEVEWQLSSLGLDQTGMSIAPYSFFLIGESALTTAPDLDVGVNGMDLATGEAGFSERAVSIEATVGATPIHMDYVLYGRHDGSDSTAVPPGDLPFDGVTFPRAEVCRVVTGTDSFGGEGVLQRVASADLYAGFAIEGYYTDDTVAGTGFPPGVWTSSTHPASTLTPRNSSSPAVLPPAPDCAGDQDCDDGDPCNGSETCNLGTGECEPGTALVDDTPCLDGDVCNGDETCQGGVCTAGAAPDCDDLDPCTVDSCDAVNGCEHEEAADGTACADGDLCNGDETCQAGSCTAGTILDCDDGVTCTDDSCDPVLGCQNVDNCPAGEFCDTDQNACQPANVLPIVIGDAFRYFKGLAEPTPGDLTAWTQIGFDDSGWEEGPTGIGYDYYAETDGTNGNGDYEPFIATQITDMRGCTPVDPPLCNDPGYVSLYLRRSFHVADPANVTSLTLQWYADDGCVIYLNGTEVARSTSMNGLGDPPTFDQLSGGLGGVPTPPVDVTLDISASISELQAGENVLAVQAHNTSLSSRDMLIIAQLDAVIEEPCTGDEDCDDGNPCNGVETCDIPSAQCQSGTPVDCGTQYCDPADGMCVDCLTDAHCDDLNPCTDDFCTTGSCDNTFNTDPCDDGDVCTESDACASGVCEGTPVDCDDGVACTDDSCDSLLGCQNVDNCTGGLICNPGSGICELPPPADPLPILIGDDWAYFKGTQEPALPVGDLAWAQVGFNDAAWASGPSGFGYGDIVDSRFGDMVDGYVSVYFRREFYIDNPAAVATLTLTLDYDDAFVAYINGVEVVRTAGLLADGDGTPSGVPTTYDQLANFPVDTSPAGGTNQNHESSNGSSGNPAESFELGTGVTTPTPPAGVTSGTFVVDTDGFDLSTLLVAGNNCIAIHGHNTTITSSDFVIVPTLEMTEIPAVMSCLLDIDTAEPNASVNLDVLVEDALGVRGYETKIAITRTSGTGSVSVECPGGVEVDEGRLDYIFNGAGSTFPVVNCPELRASSSLLSGSVDVGMTAAYLSGYTLTVSPDATPGSTFEIEVLPYNSSLLYDEISGEIPFVVGPVCELTIVTAPGDCFIGGDWYDDGDPNPENECEECDSLQSTTAWSPLSGTACDDELFCNGADTCDAGVCSLHAGDPCDDGVSCTVDSCNESTDSCDNIADDVLCDNGVFCDGVETCDEFADCQAGTPVNCDDGVSCTVDSCNETTDSCDNIADDVLCDNGVFCDGVETCDEFADCQAGTPVNCDDGVSCTVDSCNETTDSCDNIADDALCANADYCDGVETCDFELGCQAGTPVNCDDGVSCTVDSCNEITDSCDNIADDVLCDNGVFCDGVETCDELADCQPGTPPCADPNGCEECDEDMDACNYCVLDVGGSGGVIGQADFSVLAGCYGLCYPSGDPCEVANFNQSADGCIGTSDFALFAGCWNQTCFECANCFPSGGMREATRGAAYVALVAVQRPTREEVLDVLPQSDQWLPVGKTFYVEVWASGGRFMDGMEDGLAAVYADVVFDDPLANTIVAPESTMLSVKGVIPSVSFPLFAMNLNADEAASVPGEMVRVKSVGGCAALGDTTLGVNASWAKVATLEVYARRKGQVLVHTQPALRPLGIAVINHSEDLDASQVKYGEAILRFGQPIKANRGVRSMWIEDEK